jgi:hypothetical protein
MGFEMTTIRKSFLLNLNEPDGELHLSKKQKEALKKSKYRTYPPCNCSRSSSSVHSAPSQ